MSFFGFGKRRSAIETGLIEHYGQSLAAQFGSISQGRKVAEEWLDQVKAEGEAEGTINVTNFAELMLNSTSPQVQARLQAKRADGVTDADIRWWWGMHDLERRMMVKMDDVSRLAVYMKKKDEGLTGEQAGAEVRRFFPMYGDPTDTTLLKDDHRYLPYELKDRVNRWMEGKARDPNFPRQLAEWQSFNALVRSEIRAGRI